jgi:hypothetical protein
MKTGCRDGPYFTRSALFKHVTSNEALCENYTIALTTDAA